MAYIEYMLKFLPLLKIRHIVTSICVCVYIFFSIYTAYSNNFSSKYSLKPTDDTQNAVQLIWPTYIQ